MKDPLVLVLVLVLGCRSVEKEEPDAASSAPPPQPTTTAEPSAVPAPTAVASTDCPADMALVKGNYCPLPLQPCLEQPKGGQCRRYGPSRCLSHERRAMRFCMDHYEWPNQKGALPRTLTPWPEAQALCASVGKRVCFEDEFTFACEGESMKPHVYGFERDPTACNIDRPYIQRTFSYAKWDACLADPACKAEFDRLDQRVPSGNMPRCVSDDGVFDLNGNVNEWVTRPHAPSPHRAVLKGGWWGPIRARCRPVTTFHPEGDYGYEEGFRCCKDAG